MIVAQQFYAIVGVHLYDALIAKRLHMGGILLNSISARRSMMRWGTLKQKFQLAGTIEILHTKSNYGMHYGSVGLITITTFAEVRFYLSLTIGINSFVYFIVLSALWSISNVLFYVHH